MEDDLIFLKIEDDLNFLENGRQPQFKGKWKTTSIFWQKEDDIIFFVTGRRPQCLYKWKPTTVS